VSRFDDYAVRLLGYFLGLSAVSLILLVMVIVFSVAFRAAAAEDFTLRDSCEVHWGDFTDGSMTTAADDTCDGGGGQGGEDTLLYLSGSTADDGDAPPGSRPGADSILLDGTIYGCMANVTALGWNNERTLVGWFKSDVSTAVGIRMRKGSGASLDGELKMYCSASPKLKVQFETRTQAVGGSECPTDTWIYQAGSHDRLVTNTVESYSSQSDQAGTLLECNDAAACKTLQGAPDASLSIGIGCSSALSDRYTGNVGETALFNEHISAGEHCEMCRCGIAGNLRGRGRVDECATAGNRCTTRAYRSRCRRIL
jgi:hypothetical protein